MIKINLIPEKDRFMPKQYGELLIASVIIVFLSWCAFLAIKKLEERQDAKGPRVKRNVVQRVDPQSHYPSPVLSDKIRRDIAMLIPEGSEDIDVVFHNKVDRPTNKEVYHIEFVLDSKKYLMVYYEMRHMHGLAISFDFIELGGVEE